MLLLSLGVIGDAKKVTTLSTFDFKVDGRADSLGTVTLQRGDRMVGDPATISADGTVTIQGLKETLEEGEYAIFDLLGSVRSDAAEDSTFTVKLEHNAAIRAAGPREEPVEISGAPVSGGERGVSSAKSLLLFAGQANPPSAPISERSKGVPMLQFQAQARTPSNEGVRISSITVTAIGSADDSTAVCLVYLYRDENRNGLAEAGMDIAVGTGTYDTDDGTVTFSGLSDVVPAGGDLTYLVAYELSASGANAQTLIASLGGDNAIKAEGAISKKTVVVTGAPVTGGTRTIAAD